MRIRFLVSWLACFVAVGLLQPLQLKAAPRSIINGNNVTDEEHAWVVALVQASIKDDYLAQFCGGTLIAAQWVLTSAHCTYDRQEKLFPAADLAILVGGRTLRSSKGVRLPVDRIIRHPQFDNVTYSHDIALLRLAKAATVPPVQLVDATEPKSIRFPSLARIVGWGITRAGVGANILQQGDTLLVPTQTCRDFYATYHVQIDEAVLCTTYQQGKADACMGDSGGPLLFWDSRQRLWVQIGIISWGVGCAEAEFYGVYTEVASFRDWIRGILNSQPL